MSAFNRFIRLLGALSAVAFSLLAMVFCAWAFSFPLHSLFQDINENAKYHVVFGLVFDVLLGLIEMLLAFGSMAALYYLFQLMLRDLRYHWRVFNTASPAEPVRW